jgi:hypothetical protein
MLAVFVELLNTRTGELKGLLPHLFAVNAPKTCITKHILGEKRREMKHPTETIHFS